MIRLSPEYIKLLNIVKDHGPASASVIGIKYNPDRRTSNARRCAGRMLTYMKVRGYVTCTDKEWSITESGEFALKHV